MSAAPVLWPPDGPAVAVASAIRPRYEQMFADSNPKLATMVRSTCVDGSITPPRLEASGALIYLIEA